jgi:hypothetical protein
MPSAMNIDTSRIVKLLAAQYDFDAAEGAEFLAAASVSKTARTTRANRTDFLDDLAVAETKDEAKASAKAKAAAKKAEREAKKAAKEAKPKRAPTGYLLFCAYLRPEVKAALEKDLDEGEKLKPTDTVRELAAQWKELSDEERAEWNAKAALVKESMAAQLAGATSSDSE